MEGSQFVGGTNNQTIWGNVGADRIIAYGGTNHVDAGGGADSVSFGLYGLPENADGVNTLMMKAGNGADYLYEFESGVDKVDLIAFHFGITGQQVLDQAVNVDNPGTADDYCYSTRPTPEGSITSLSSWVRCPVSFRPATSSLEVKAAL